MEKLLSGKTALITGAGRNIGRAIAIEMARQGVDVYFIDIKKDLIEGLDAELRRIGAVGAGFVSDVSKPEDTDRLLEELTKRGIKIDILVNNVGVGSEEKIPGFEELRRVFDVNVFGPLHLTKKVIEKMVENKIEGAIIFISSIHQESIRRFPAYSASKAAIGMIVKELAVELAPKNIRVNAIAPGFVGVDEKNQPYFHKSTPLHHQSIPPEYIGRAAVYLASDYFSKHTTGAILKVDAGLSLYNHLIDEISPR